MDREISGRLKKIMKLISDSSAVKKFGKKPQMNADERRFVNFKAQQSSGTYSETKLNKSPQSTQRMQSIKAKLFARWYGKVTQNRTRIARIFTDTSNPRASASSVQSVFYPKRFNNVSAFICVHLRLNELDHNGYSKKWSEIYL